MNSIGRKLLPVSTPNKKCPPAESRTVKRHPVWKLEEIKFHYLFSRLQVEVFDFNSKYAVCYMPESLIIEK